MDIERVSTVKGDVDRCRADEVRLVLVRGLVTDRVEKVALAASHRSNLGAFDVSRWLRAGQEKRMPTGGELLLDQHHTLGCSTVFTRQGNIMSATGLHSNFGLARRTALTAGSRAGISASQTTFTWV